ncbi:hypothetical protein T484DRAFT_1784971 [Baffinella frigidus]|nr:hypothetical protein T484DRAFT_1784971 [Cryptophyta sp. CCMP2293]
MPAKGGGNRAELKIQDAFETGNIEAVVLEEDGCLVLLNLASRKEENRRGVARAGGIEAVVAGMEAQRWIEQVQEYGRGDAYGGP